MQNFTNFKRGWKRKSTYKTKNYKYKRVVTNKQVKRRIMWSLEETTVLCQQWQIYNNQWVIIQDYPALYLRNNKNCKDKFRNLRKEFNVITNKEAAKKWLETNNM